jgi:phage terminase small subunit
MSNFKKPQKLPFGTLGQDPLLAERLATIPTRSKPLKMLTPVQTKFIHEIVAGEGKLTQKEAAIRAGVPKEKAAHTASAWLQLPTVIIGIQQFRAQLAEKYGTNFDRHMRDMQIIRDKALEAGNYGAAVQAEYRRGQALGTIYIDRKEIRHGTIDTMSKEEVMRKLQSIKTMYLTGAQGIEDIETKEQLEEQTEEEILDGYDTGSEALPVDQEEHDEGISDEDRVEGDSGDTGRFGSFAFDEKVDDVRVENSKPWVFGKT